MIYIDGNSLSLDQFIRVVFSFESVGLTEDSKKKITESRDLVNSWIDQERPIYGLNTGFGFLANKKIPKDKIEQLQINLIRSHCTGVGPSYPEHVIRGIMLLRANVMAKGFSGIRLSVVEKLLELLNKRVHAFIPSQGSVGASGDLAPLAHLAITLIGEGRVFFQGKQMEAADCFQQLNITPVVLEAKEGLVLINGTQAMTANGAIQLYYAKNLVKSADIIGAITLNSVLGTDKAFDPKILEARPHPGQAAVGRNLNRIIKQSTILSSHQNCHKIQDAYSLRCIPQVHGAIRDVLKQVEETIVREMNSATDNPLVFTEEKEILSGGNFHGEPVAFAMDFLAIAIAELANISERRIEHMVNPHLNEHLPAFLVKNEGLNSGLMIAQVTAASLVSENKIYAHPSSVDSIPTSANKEDHVSMGTIGSNKASRVIKNVTHVLGIEYLTAAQALEFRRPLSGGVGVETAMTLLRKVVPFLEEDQILNPLITNATDLIRNRELVTTVEAIVGELE